MSVANARGRFSQPKIGICIDKLTAVLNTKPKVKGAVVKLYLENFKSYNDSFGYAFGGMLIDEITAFLESVEGVQVFHIRGVEYIILIENSSQQAVKAILDNIMQRFDNSWVIGNYSCVCTVNAAVAYLPGYTDNADELLEQLGLAINESAQQGQNHLIEYNEVLRNKYARLSVIAQQIPQAVDNGAIEMFFQPTYQVSKKRYTRIDGNMRMYCEGIGFVRDTEFIPVAEKSGQIYTISRFAITKACELIKQLLALGKDFETVAVKVSPIQLLQERFYDDVAETIANIGIPPNRLALEIGESALNSAFSHVHVCIDKLSAMGVEMILSGFGSGSFGIHQILSMSIDVVKTTRPLMWQMENTPNGTFLMDGLIKICKYIGLKLVAEGVETEEQAKQLGAFECEYQQGFFYSHSIAADKLIPMLKDLA